MSNIDLTLDEKQLRALLDVGKVASSDESRSLLTGVCVEVTSRNVWAIATDSYMLVIRHIAEGDFGIRMRLVIPAKALGDAAKAAAKRASIEKRRRGALPPYLNRHVQISDEGITFETVTGSISVAPHPHAHADSSYPDVAKVVSDATKDVKGRPPLEHVTLNPQFVARIGEALGTKDALMVEFTGGGLRAVLVASCGTGVDIDQDQRSIGLLMPVRSEVAARLDARYRKETDPVPAQKKGARTKKARKKDAA